VNDHFFFCVAFICVIIITIAIARFVKLQRNCNLSALHLEDIFETVGAMVDEKDDDYEAL
jgi:hypothetical protein